MKYSKTVVLKDGRTCIIRNGTRQDAQGVWDNFVLTHGETEYLTTYPEEVTFTLEQEEAYLKQKEESDRDAALLAEVDGKVVGTAGVDSLNAAEKTSWSWKLSRITSGQRNYTKVSDLQSMAGIRKASVHGTAAGRRMCSCGWNCKQADTRPVYAGRAMNGRCFSKCR